MMLLHNFVCGIECQEVDTFHPRHEVPALIQVTLAAYKNTFHSSRINPSKPTIDVLGDIFVSMNTTTMWRTVRDKLCESVYLSSFDFGEKINKCKSRDEFFKAIINVYTHEQTRLYDVVNTALRRERARDFKPTSGDLALGPYILVYNLLLMFWNKLGKESRTTYRKMLLSKRDQDKYLKGVKFTWLSFVSSSVAFEKAIPFPTYEREEEICTYPTIFIFDNTCACRWQPRNIEEFAMYEEEERVYPAGSHFLVTNRTEENGDTRIYLKLLSD